MIYGYNTVCVCPKKATIRPPLQAWNTLTLTNWLPCPVARITGPALVESHVHEGDQKVQGDHSGCTLGVDIKTNVTFFLNLITVPSHLHQAFSDTSKKNICLISKCQRS